MDRSYIVAKANATALPFVARAEKERDGWIVLLRTDSYAEACEARDAAIRATVRS